MGIDDAPPYQDPETQKEEWKLVELQAWLKARGLDSKGKKEELKKRVFDLLLGPPINVPPVLPPMYGTAADMIEVVKSMVVLVTMIFQDRVEESTRDILELRIRIFLTRFEEFDKPMRAKDVKPTWLSSYNYLCLLNLPATIHEFGPPRRWYEGKWLGERYVSTVKDERSRCPPHNLHKILMRNLHRTKALDDITRHMKKGLKEEMTALNTKIFACSMDIESAYHSRYPLPLVLMSDSTFGCLYYERGRNIGKSIMIKLLTKHELEGNETIHDGLRYWEYKLEEKSGETMNETRIVDYGVLLPQLGNDQQGVYTIVTKNWSTVMFGDYNFQNESENYVQDKEENNCENKYEV
jgi:SAP domain